MSKVLKPAMTMAEGIESGGKTLYVVLTAGFGGKPRYAVVSVAQNCLWDQFPPPPPSSDLEWEEAAAAKTSTTPSSKSSESNSKVVDDDSNFFYNIDWLCEDDEDLCYHMGVGISGSSIYFVGGYYHSSTVPFIGYRWFRPGENVSVYNTLTRKLDKSSVPPMNSGKMSPLVVAIRDTLYVLVGQVHNSDVPPVPAFESYDTTTTVRSGGSWKVLACPPFLDPSSRYYNSSSRDVLGFVVFGNRHICVSTDQAAFFYDVESDIWFSCYLFGQCIPHYSSSPPPPAACRGAPFDMLGQAMLFDHDTLICVQSLAPQLVAYQMIDGKVARSQRLNIPAPLSYSFSHLSDFGNGYFCLVGAIEAYRDGSDYDLVVVSLTTTLIPFTVKKKRNTISCGLQEEGDDNDGFLRCEVGNAIDLNDAKVLRPFDFWVPLGCFALN